MKILSILVIIILVGCGNDIRGNPIGDLTVQQAVQLYKTHPTVVEWLAKTNAMASVNSNGIWCMRLKDGIILYTEYKELDGYMYIEHLGCNSDDVETRRKLDTANMSK